jgi:hypothetical protein
MSQLGTITYYLANALMNEAFHGTGFSSPSTFAALYTGQPSRTGGGVEVNQDVATSYGRKSITFAVAVNGSVSNTNTVNFPSGTASQNWGVVGWVGILDALIGGNLLWWAPLNTTATVSTGSQVSFSPGAIILNMQ